MGLFKKNKKEEVPKLPELPRLPELKNSSSPSFPSLDDDSSEDYTFESFHKLPSYPNGHGAEKFSQNTIKDAITGRESEYPEESIMPPRTELPEEFLKREEDENLIQSPPETLEPKRISSPRTTRIEEKEPEEKGPVFIRIDKFEDSLKFIKSTKEKISEVSNLLSETKKLKQEEAEELENWENSLKELKTKIEKIEKDLTSKL